MRRLFGLALVAIIMACGFAARAEEGEYDPAKVSDSLRAIFQFGSAQTKQALNANTVTLITGTIGGTYVQIGADLASVLDDGNKLRVLPIVGRGSVQSVADILFLQGVDVGIVRSDTLDYLEKKGFAKDIKRQFTFVSKPYKSVSTFQNDGRFHLVTVDYDRPLQGDYLPASLTAKDYPNLIAEGETVDTIAVPAVLAAYNWAPGSERYRKLSQFVDAFFSKFPTLQNPPFHPKWKEVSLAAPLAGWTRLPYAQQWLDTHGIGATARSRFDDFMNQNPAASKTAPQSQTDREALFKQFQAWQADQTAKEGARAQVGRGKPQ